MTTTGMARDSSGAGPSEPAPAVSVVVPCYNGGPFLDGLMASLARQTFRDFEIIIVDDGSTDPRTQAKLASLDPVIRVIRQDNRGPSAARNTGARPARADIIFMLDCDDAIEPTFLAETVPVMRDAPADVGMVFTHLRLVGAETGVVPRYFNQFDLLFTNTLSSGLVMRKQSMMAAGGYDETMREGYEDWDFSLRLARAGYRGLEIPKTLYIYHIASDDTAPSRSSYVHKKRLYGQLWRMIRRKHADCYRPLSMFRLWQASRDGSGHIPLWKGFAAYALSLLLPDAWFNLLIGRFHRRHMSEAQYPAYEPAGAKSKFAA
jgi:glycosyltransferase involved in cell wall biosynthesis